MLSIEKHRILIYGTGTFAERYFESTKEIIGNFPVELCGYIDSRAEIEEFHGYKVYHIDKIRKLSYDMIYIYAYEKSYVEIYHKLTDDYGVNQSKLGNLSDLLALAQASYRKNYGKQNRTPIIYDCFTFFNELEMLRIRLETLDSVVDRFVLVEMEKDHHGKDKNCYFKEHEKEFGEFRDKIVYVKPDELPNLNVEYTGRWNWILEHFQRECIKLGLHEAQPEDIILVSDCDEIPNPSILKELRESRNNPYPTVTGRLLDCTSIALKQDYYYFNFNWHCVTRRNTTTVTKYKNLISPQLIRDLMDYLPYVDKGGWHLTYFGGVDRIRTKMNSIVEGDYSKVSDKEIYERIMNGKDIWGREGHEFELEYIPLERMDFPNIFYWSDKFPHMFLDSMD